eukprot:gene25806-biopygen24019
MLDLQKELLYSDGAFNAGAILSVGLTAVCIDGEPSLYGDGVAVCPHPRDDMLPRPRREMYKLTKITRVSG